VDPEKQFVVCDGGIKLEDLERQLAMHQLALRNLGSISMQAMGGVITTATHGTGIEFKILGDDVLSLSLLLADGTLVYCSRHENEDLFKATLCGLGSTGLIVSVQIRVEPAFRLRESQETRPFEEILGNLHEIVHQAQHVRLWWYPQNKSVRICSADRTTEVSLVSVLLLQARVLIEFQAGTARCERKGLATRPFDASPCRISPLPCPIHSVPCFLYRQICGMDGICSQGRHRREWLHSPDRLQGTFLVSRLSYSGLMNHFRIVDMTSSLRAPSSAEQFAQHTTEWAIPYERTKECLVHLREWLENEPYTADGTYPHFPIELRFSAPDDIWLSPAYGRRTCWIGIIQFKYVVSVSLSYSPHHPAD